MILLILCFLKHTIFIVVKTTLHIDSMTEGPLLNFCTVDGLPVPVIFKPQRSSPKHLIHTNAMHAAIALRIVSSYSKFNANN